ncbi:MAG: response regulator transcription factor [Candidatus Pacebacteria bacterium]|nr:response regulator transcription factor [Candidatus Paceibacterota bacterium]
MDKVPLILICDDEPIVHESLSLYLMNEGFHAVSAFDGLEAVEYTFSKKPTLVILDLMIPKMTGIEVCKEIRKQSKIPIIILSAKGEEFDRILGLEIGADDYIVKPFSPREVVARIKAVLRRIDEKEANDGTNDLKFGDLEISLDKYEIRVDNKVLDLTPKEIEILHLLASHPGQVFSREQILNSIWGFEYTGDTRTVDTHIKRIRQKIQIDNPACIIYSVYGVGYKFESTVS